MRSLILLLFALAMLGFVTAMAVGGFNFWRWAGVWPELIMVTLCVIALILVVWEVA